MLEFNKCCFCIPLRTGCLILGYLHLVASIILAIMSVISLAAVGAAMANEDLHIDQGSAGAAIAVAVILLLLVIILLTFSILLVVGLHKVLSPTVESSNATRSGVRSPFRHWDPNACRFFELCAPPIATSRSILFELCRLLWLSSFLICPPDCEKKNYVKAYLIYYLIFIVLYAILYIVRIASAPFDLSYTLGTLVEILLSVYFLLVIRSHWVTMRENNFNTA